MSQIHLLGAPPPKALPADGGRIDGDAYYTPDRLARAGVAAIHAAHPIGGLVWEPHVGGGAWARALLDLTPASVLVSDISRSAPGINCYHYTRDGIGRPVRSLGPRDFLSTRPSEPPLWIIGNPPYDRAEEHVRRALALSARHVVMLLRLAFVESDKRVSFWREHPHRHIWALSKRPSFTEGGGTDACPYGLFWWDKADPREGFKPCWAWNE